MVLPVFLLSDSLNVGYAAPWLGAPLHLYSSQPMSNLDDVQANWRDSFGDVNLSAQATYGKAEAYGVLPHLGSFHIDSKDTYAFSATAEYRDWTARVDTVRLNTPFTGIPDIEPTIHDKYVSAGPQYDNGSALVLAEWAKRTQKAMPFVGKVIEGKYAYVAAGWRFGSVLPMDHLIQGRQRDDGRHRQDPPVQRRGEPALRRGPQHRPEGPDRPVQGQRPGGLRDPGCDQPAQGLGVQPGRRLRLLIAPPAGHTT